MSDEQLYGMHVSGVDHAFLPVAGHPDDDECTHRSDGTDETYCGLTEAEHQLDTRAICGDDEVSTYEHGSLPWILETFASTVDGSIPDPARAAMRSAARQLEHKPTYRQGYLHGWNDAKAGRQYGQGRVAVPPRDALAEGIAREECVYCQSVDATKSDPFSDRPCCDACFVDLTADATTESGLFPLDADPSTHELVDTVWWPKDELVERFDALCDSPKGQAFTADERGGE